MGVFLTSNSSGLRTSPVRRGYWVVHRLLGEHIPPPPPQVPDLPADEADLGDATLREVLANHRRVAMCAKCHDRFDSFGLVFEGYGPVGRLRKVDGGGRKVDVRCETAGIHLWSQSDDVGTCLRINGQTVLPRIGGIL